MIERELAFGLDQADEVAERAGAKAAQRDGRLQPAVLAAPDVWEGHARCELERRVGTPIAGVRRVAAGVRGVAGGVHQRPHHRCLRGHVEVLTTPGTFALVEGDDGVSCSLRTGVKRRLRVANGHGWPVAVSLQAEQSPGRLDRQFRGRAESVRPGLPIWRDRDVDQARVQLC